MRNKRIVLNLTVATVAFGLGIVSSSLRPHYQLPPSTLPAKSETPVCVIPGYFQKEIINIDYCDLMANPERYDRQIVRFDAVMLADPNYEPLNDTVNLGTPVCEDLLVVHEGFHLTSGTCLAVLQKLDSLLMRHDPSYPRKNAKVRVVGRFFSSRDTILSSGQERWESERFTIIAVERAASIDEDN